MSDLAATVRLSLTGALVAVILAPGQAAARETFQIGAWHGTAYPKYGDRFTHCSMNAPYRSGTYLMFRITRGGAFQMGLFKKGWSVRQGARYTLSLAVDHGPAYVGTAIATSSNGVWMRLPSRDWMLQRLRWGRTLRISSGRTNLAYRLTGTAVALQRLLHCVKSELAVEAGRPRPAFVARVRNPAGSNAGARSGTKSVAHMRLKATTLVANLFNKAGLSHFELVDPDAKPPSMKNYDVVWKGPGLLGGLRMVDRGTRTDAQKIGAALIAQDALVCKGQFSSGIKSDRSEKSAGAVRLFTACQTAKSWHALYSIHPRPKGGFVMIVQIARGALGRLREADERVFNALPAVLQK